MELLTRVKNNLGIAHNMLDDEIMETVDEGKLELLRLGVPEHTVMNDESKLINSALVSYTCMRRTIGSDVGEAWEKAWDYQSDCIRKTDWSTSDEEQ